MPSAIPSNHTAPNTAALRESHRPLATYHATLLQQRQDIELQILCAIESFLEFPTSAAPAHPADPRPDPHSSSVAPANPADPDPAFPTSTDIAAFRSHIHRFQVSDYDELLHERNIGGKCGYVFCPQAYRDVGSSTGGGGRRVGKFQLLPGGKMVMAGDVRKFCSRGCARRAMFVKGQLSEVPAWERRAGEERGKGGEVELLIGGVDGDGEGRGEGRTRIADLGVEERNDRDGEQTLPMQMQALAVERGEESTSIRRQDLLKGGIVEKQIRSLPRPPDAGSAGFEVGSSIEGYTPLRLPDRSRRKEADLDDEDDVLDLL